MTPSMVDFSYIQGESKLTNTSFINRYSLVLGQCQGHGFKKKDLCEQFSDLKCLYNGFNVQCVRHSDNNGSHLRTNVVQHEHLSQWGSYCISPYVIKLHVSTFSVLHSDVRYDFRVKRMLDSSGLTFVLQVVHLFNCICIYLRLLVSTRFPYQMMFVQFNTNKMAVTYGAGMANPSGAPNFTPAFQWGSCCSILFFCVMFC